MLSHRYRITTEKDILRILCKGIKRHGQLMSLYRCNNDKKQLRATVIAGKKVHKQAVKRNKVKRQLRAILQEQEQKTAAKDIVVVAKKQAVQASYQELEKEYQELQQWINRYEEKGNTNNVHHKYPKKRGNVAH